MSHTSDQSMPAETNECEVYRAIWRNKLYSVAMLHHDFHNKILLLFNLIIIVFMDNLHSMSDLSICRVSSSGVGVQRLCEFKFAIVCQTLQTCDLKEF